MKCAAVLALGVVLMLGACAVRRPVDLINALTPRSTFSLTSGIAYGEGARHMLDVYQPAKQARRMPKDGQRPPIIVFFYGGSWQSGNRSDYLFVGEALASRGFVVVVPDYRTYPETIFPGFIDDGAAAVRWAHDHASELGADPSRLFLMGHSAGAQIIALLATDAHFLAARQMSKKDIAGVIGLAGPYDFLPLRDATLKRIFPEAQRTASQPIHFVRGDEPPMWLGVGKADMIVDPGNTTRFAARLQASGDKVEVRRYPGIGHILLIGAMGAPMRWIAPVLDDVATFIDAH